MATYNKDMKIAMLETIQKAIDEATQREIEKLKALVREPQTHCIKCGKEITDYEDTEFNQEQREMRFTYKCSCGFYGEQVFDVKYNRTEEMK